MLRRQSQLARPSTRPSARTRPSRATGPSARTSVRPSPKDQGGLHVHMRRPVARVRVSCCTIPLACRTLPHHPSMHACSWQDGMCARCMLAGGAKLRRGEGVLAMACAASPTTAPPLACSAHVSCVCVLLCASNTCAAGRQREEPPLLCAPHGGVTSSAAAAEAAGLWRNGGLLPAIACVGRQDVSTRSRIGRGVRVRTSTPLAHDRL